MPYTILIVEGDASKRTFLHNALVRLGDVTLRSVERGSDAIALFNTHPSDMVLSSLAVPGMESAEFMHELATFKHKPALAIMDTASRKTMVSASLTARSLGFTVVGLISKPLDLVDLRDLHIRLRGSRTATRLKSVALHKYDSATVKDALSKGQIRPRFRPRKNLRTGRITAAKAVAAWDHPESGLLLSTDFLPGIACDECDAELLMHMLSGVISAQRAWRKSGNKVPVWIKLPVHLLDHPDTPDRLYHHVLSQGGDPLYIGFELLKRSPGERLMSYLDAIYQLRLKGFGLAPDDVGQGFSFYFNLECIPFTHLTLFFPLVRSAVNNEKLAASLTRIVSDSQQLGLSIVAEGIVTREELAMLHRIDCDEVEGVLISEAVDQQHMASLLVENNSLFL